MQNKSPWVLQLLVAVSALFMSATNGVAAETGVLTPCDIPDVKAARCAAIDVPENPSLPNGRRLQLAVVVIPATAGPALRDPIVPLMGGPGEDSISAAAIFAERFASILRDRDLLLIDQRGTGRSGGLLCDFYSPDEAAANLRDFFPLAAVKRCEQKVRPLADLTQYSYAHFSNDLEHVRRVLGYGPLNLSAGSYGTRAAQVFLRTHPESVRTVYLGSVVPIDVPIPLPLAKAAQAALDKTLAACAADPECHAAFPNVRDELREVLARLQAGVLVAVPGSEVAARLDRGRVVEWFRARLYRAESAAAVPWLIHQAYLGNWNPIVDGILSDAEGRDAGTAMSFGLFFSITCNEDIPFLRSQDVTREVAGTLLGDYRVRQQQAACKDWPKASLPVGYREPVRSAVPTLFVSGDSDPAAPLWLTDRVARGFANRAEIVQRDQGHTEWNECVSQLYEQLVRTGEVRELNPARCKPTPRPRFKTR